MEFFQNTNIDFLGKKWYFLAFSLVFSVAGKGFAWSWMERVHPKTPRQPRLDVLAVRCVREEKDTLLEAKPELYVLDDHYNGFPAILVRLPAIGVEELEALIVEGWRCQAPRGLAKRYALASGDAKSVGERRRSLPAGSRRRPPTGAGEQ